MEEKLQNKRLLSIHRLLQDGFCLNAEDFAQRFEVSSRTIQRDIRYMKDVWKAPIATKGIHRGYYYKEEFIDVPAIMLNEAEIFSVLVLDKLLPYYTNTPFAAALYEIREKLLDILPQKIAIKKSEALNRILILDSSPMTIELEKWELILHALENSRVLEFTYTSQWTRSHGNLAIRRETLPYQIIGNNASWYLFAFDIYSKEHRIFAFSRMKNLKVSKKSFNETAYNNENTPEKIQSIIEEFQKKESYENAYFTSPWGVYNNEQMIDVELEYSDFIALMIEERTWIKNQKITRLQSNKKNSKNILSFSTDQLTPLVHWILSWGSEMKVRKPSKLQNLIRDELQKACALY